MINKVIKKQHKINIAMYIQVSIKQMSKIAKLSIIISKKHRKIKHK
jgi:hypothetical protein